MKTNKAEKNTIKYNLLKANKFEDLNLFPDEQIKHCCDNAKTEYYQTGWLVTNKGRIWSLTHKRWLIPWNDNGYWRIANTYVHGLVCYYFMSDDDKDVLQMVEEHNKECNLADKWNIEIHHKKTVEKFNYINMTNKERIDACMKVNYKDNLIYQIKKDHLDIHKIVKGKTDMGKDSKGYERKVQLDATLSVMMNSGALVYFTYDENGKKELNTKLILPTLTPEEEEKYNKKLYTKTDTTKIV